MATRQPDPEKVKREEADAMKIQNTGPAPYRREHEPAVAPEPQATPRGPEPERQPYAGVTQAHTNPNSWAAGPNPHQVVHEGAPGVSVPAVTPHDPGYPVLSAPANPGVSPVVGKALAKDRRDVPGVPVLTASGPRRETREEIQARQRVEGDPHGAPPATGAVGAGDAEVLAECLRWLAKLTDHGSLTTVRNAAAGRISVPEVVAPKQSGHTV